MSRYKTEIDESSYIIYGFDRPLSEYFYQVWKVFTEEDVDLPEEEDLVGEMYQDSNSIWNGHQTNIELYETLVSHGVWEKIPESHRQAITGGFPF